MTRWLRDAYELTLVLVAGWLLLFPLHRASLEGRDVLRTLADGSALIDGRGLAAGEVLPAYRFNPGWILPIGRVRVERTAGEAALVAPAGPMRWPIGRQGRIVTEASGTVTLDVGSELGLEPGRNLGVYDGRRWLGDVRLTEVGRGRSTAHVAFRPDRPITGLPVTEFTFMTQVVVRREPAWLLAIEAALGLGPAVAWLAVRVRTGASPLGRLGDAIRARTTAGVRRALRAAVEAPVAGLLVGWFAPSALALLVERATVVAHDAGWLAAPLDPWPWYAPAKDVVFVAAAALAGGVALATDASALAAGARWIGWDRSLVARVPERWLPAVNWTLHLFVAWAFAWTLTGFLRANLAEIAEVLGGSWGLGGAFHVAKLGLWSATIVGCLLGYGHTVLGPLFGKHVRRLDFTVAGWVTNAASYPLLGYAMARLVGGRVGLDPAVVGGLAEPAVLGLGLLTNLLYTLSIWNMGTRFGVMTDKGLVRHGFYGVVRHPSYTLESLMFLMLEAPGYSTWREWVAGLSIAWLYWLRSEREDAFLAAANPDHAAYRAQVPWKYVPGLW